MVNMDIFLRSFLRSISHTHTLMHKQEQSISTTNKQGCSMAFKGHKVTSECVFWCLTSPRAVQAVQSWLVGEGRVILVMSSLAASERTCYHTHLSWYMTGQTCCVCMYLYVCIGLHSKPCNKYDIFQHKRKSPATHTHTHKWWQAIIWLNHDRQPQLLLPLGQNTRGTTLNTKFHCRL